MGFELEVYASFIKDAVYSTALLLVLWILRYPTWSLFAIHIVTWGAALCFYLSVRPNWWLSTLALLLSLPSVLGDAFVLVNSLCYLRADTCCTVGATTTPFSLSYKVCGDETRYDTESLVFIVIFTVSIGVLTGLYRLVSISFARPAASVHVTLTVLYVVLKIYVLSWSNVSYAWYFYIENILSLAGDVAAAVINLRFRLPAVLIYVGVLVLDLIMMLDAGKLLTFTGTQTIQRRHLLSKLTLTAPDRSVLALALNVLTSARPSDERQALQKAQTMVAAFQAAVQKTCSDARAAEPAFACHQSLAAVARVVSATGDFSTVTNHIKTLDNTWDAIWMDETERYSTASDGNIMSSLAWATKTKAPAPPAVTWVWTTLHVIFFLITILQIFEALISPARRSRAKVVADADVDTADDDAQDDVQATGTFLYGAARDGARRRV